MAASTAVGRLVLAAGDVDLIHRLRALLGRPGGPDVEVCQDAASALATLRGEPSLAALVGPPLSTLAFLSELRRAHPDLPIVALAEEADVYAAVEAMRAGASDYLLVRDLARLPELLTALSAEGRVAVEGGAEARSRRERWESEREVLQTAMANTGAHIAYLDADFNFVLANEAYCRGGGYSLDELVGHNHFALFAHAENEEIFRRVRDTGEPYFAYARPFRYPHRPDLGTTYWDWSLVPVRGSDGRVRGLVLSLMDVTEKGRLARENEEQRAALEAANAELQRANEELRASEGRYRLLFEHMTEEVHYWELIRDDEGRVCSWRLVDANPPVLRSWGKRLEDIRGRTTEEIFGPQETTRYLAAIQEADAEGVPHTVEVYHPDRDQRFRVTLVPLGEHLMVTGIDLTEVVRAQEALKREQELLQAIYDAIPVMLTVYDPRLERISLSRHVERVTGWTDEDTARTSIMELVYPDPDYRREIAAYMRSLQPGFRDVDMATKGGGVVRTSWANVRLADGRQVGIGIDMTERVRAEERLKRRLDDLSALYEASQALQATLDSGTLLQHLCELAVSRFGLCMAWVGLASEEGSPGTGLTPVAAVGTPHGASAFLTGTVASDLRDRPVLRALYSGRPVVVADLASEARFDAAWRAGELCAGHRAAAAFPLGHEGRVAGVLMVYATDGAALAEERLQTLESLANMAAAALDRARLHEALERHAETLDQIVARRTEELRASEGRLRAIFADSAIGMALLDRDGRILQANPALAGLLGVADPVGQPAALLGLEEAGQPCLLADLFARPEGPITTEVRFRRADGQARWGRVTLSAIRDGAGDPRYAIAMLEDVTGEHQARAALVRSEQFRATSQLTAAFAHEIKNPLQAVIGCLSLLEEGLAGTAMRPEAQRRFLKVARDELHRADRVVNRLRDLHRRSGGDLPQTVNLRDLLEQVLLVTQRQREHQFVELRVEQPETLPEVLGRPDELRQVFLNLVLNALDAMPGGGVLTVRAEAPEELGRVIVSIGDTGVGIPEEALARVFDFAYTTKEQGTGLGLFVCQEIMRGHGGGVSVQSKAGEGSTFTVWLPVEGRLRGE